MCLEKKLTRGPEQYVSLIVAGAAGAAGAAFSNTPDLVMGVCDLVPLLWSKVDVYDLIHSRDFTIWSRFGSGYIRFSPIW